jgi:hypothetical protein
VLIADPSDSAARELINKTDITDVVRDDGMWIELAHDRVQWRVSVLAVLIFRGCEVRVTACVVYWSEFLATQRRCIVFAVRYELNLYSYMLCKRK